MSQGIATLVHALCLRLQPAECNTSELLYDSMESQSAFQLPLIYQPFDGRKRAHWADRGAALDFVFATKCEGKTVLDFGPGDGWPSLIVAPFVKQVVGVEGSQRRLAVCRENAAKLGINNAEFVYVEAGAPLPFADASFDAVVAASSLEQTPDPLATLKELFRVLKPRGSLRFSFENLAAYANGREEELWLSRCTEESCKLIFYVRDILKEKAFHLGLWFSRPFSEVATLLGQAGQVRDCSPDIAAISPSVVEKLLENLEKARCCTLRHPSTATFQQWLAEIGFAGSCVTHRGAAVAGRLWAQQPDLAAQGEYWDFRTVDALIAPTVRVAVDLEIPLEKGSAITAWKD